MTKELQASELFAALTRERSREHPSSETIVAYHLGDLPPAVHDEIAEHLAFCPGCVSEIEQLQLIGEIEGPPTEAVKASAPPKRKLAGLRVPALVFAAVLLGIALGVLVASRGVDYRLDIPRRELDLTTEAYRAAPQGQRKVGVDFAAGRDSVLLEIRLDYLPDTERYRVELFAPTGSRVLHETVAPLNPGYLNLELPRRSVKAGTYRLVVHTQPGGEDAKATAELEIRF